MSTLIRIAADFGRAAGLVGRAGGVGVGVAQEKWPHYDDEPMQHLITVTADSIIQDLPVHIAAVAVFIRSFGDNEAFEPDTDETRVIFLTLEDMDLPSWSDAPEGAPEHVLSFDEIEYELDEIADREEEDEPTPIEDMDEEELGAAISGWMTEQRSDTWVGDAEVIGLSALHVDWCQEPEAPDEHRVLFALCDDKIPNTNFGSGFLYVTANEEATDGAAWWQC